LEYRIIPGTPGRSYPFSGNSYEKNGQKIDPGNDPQSTIVPWSTILCEVEELRVQLKIYLW